MDKAVLKKMGEIEHILTERDILTRTSSPWLVKLLYAFQDTENVYFAMEYVPGGDMRTLLNNSGCLREEHARFYAAEMFLAVAELHRLGYIHRDLKPENFLIDSAGHLKLTDFGLSRGILSKDVVESLKQKNSKVTQKSVHERRNIYQSVRKEDMRAFSLVGSPDYMAYEVLVNNKEGYGLEVDYWSIGAILFECLAGSFTFLMQGYPPFTAATNDDVWVNVYHWESVLERPIYHGEDEEFNFSNEAWDLITCLITHPETRFKSLTQVALHPFFHSSDRRVFRFEDLRSEKSPRPPFVPKLKSENDTTYFDDFKDPNDMAIYQDVKKRQMEMEGIKTQDREATREIREAFVGFTFKQKSNEFKVLL